MDNTDIPGGGSPYREEMATTGQLVAALQALGLYSGTGTARELAAEAGRVGDDAHRMGLANALLGAAQAEAVLAEGLAGGDGDLLRAAHEEQLRTGGVMEPGSDDPDPVKLAAFLRWQTARVSGPLRVIAQDASTGPIPVAAAQAAEGLVRLLGVIAAGQVPDTGVLAEQIAELEATRECFTYAIANIDTLTGMLASVNKLLGGHR
jgi:Family of unknown function (DUF6245)